MIMSSRNARTLIIHNIQRALQYPPWTILNLIIYAVAPNSALRRGSYASMWATVVCFYAALLFEPRWHEMLMRKQDVLLHWMPLVVLYVPYKGMLANATGLSNLLWGMWITNGTMDLSEAYAPLSLPSWYCIWTLSILVTILIPV